MFKRAFMMVLVLALALAACSKASPESTTHGYQKTPRGTENPEVISVEDDKDRTVVKIRLPDGWYPNISGFISIPPETLVDEDGLLDLVDRDFGQWPAVEKSLPGESLGVVRSSLTGEDQHTMEEVFPSHLLPGRYLYYCVSRGHGKGLVEFVVAPEPVDELVIVASEYPTGTRFDVSVSYCEDGNVIKAELILYPPAKVTFPPREEGYSVFVGICRPGENCLQGYRECITKASTSGLPLLIVVKREK